MSRKKSQIDRRIAKSYRLILAEARLPNRNNTMIASAGGRSARWLDGRLQTDAQFAFDYFTARHDGYTAEIEPLEEMARSVDYEMRLDGRKMLERRISQRENNAHQIELARMRLEGQEGNPNPDAVMADID